MPNCLLVAGVSRMVWATVRATGGAGAGIADGAFAVMPVVITLAGIAGLVVLATGADNGAGADAGRGLDIGAGAGRTAGLLWGTFAIAGLRTGLPGIESGFPAGADRGAFCGALEGIAAGFAGLDCGLGWGVDWGLAAGARSLFPILFRPNGAANGAFRGARSVLPAGFPTWDGFLLSLVIRHSAP